MQFLIAATLFIGILAAPCPEVIGNRAGPHTCPGGLTNSSPQCCSVNVLGLLALECHSVPDGGCSGSSRPYCCTLGLAGQGFRCNEL